MSWDISICKFSQSYDRVEDIPETESIYSLGTRSHVALLISKIFTGTDWSDPSWGIFDCSVGSIEFNMGQNQDCDGFMLHVRAGEEVVPLIVELCRQNQWQGLDFSSGDFIEKSYSPADGQKQWQAYRDQILGG